MLELSEESRRIVESLVNGPLAWQSPAELASAMGLGLEETTDLLADLDADGWLSPWEREGHVVVTLSVGAASKLGVRLVESGREEAASVGPGWGIPSQHRPGLRASSAMRRACAVANGTGCRSRRLARGGGRAGRGGARALAHPVKPPRACQHRGPTLTHLVHWTWPDPLARSGRQPQGILSFLRLELP